MQNKILFLSYCLIAVIVLTGCNNDVVNLSSTSKKPDTYEIDTSSEDEKLHIEGFKLTISEMITKLKDKDDLKEEQMEKETIRKFILTDSSVEITLFINPGSEDFNCISIVDYEAGSKSYQIAYSMIMDILGEQDKVEILDTMTDKPAQIGNVWIKVSTDNNEKTIIITSYEE